MTSSVTKAVILAGGYGTRFLPYTKAVPKELLCVGDKPVIHYQVAELAAAGITDILVVTSRGKGAVEDYFDLHAELDTLLRARGKAAVADELAKIHTMARVSFIRQPVANGNAKALALAEAFVGNDPFVLTYVDDLVVGNPSPTQELLNIFAKTNAPALALMSVLDARVSNFGIAEWTTEADGTMSVERILEKPQPADTASRLAFFGRLVLTPQVFSAISRIPAAVGGEWLLTDAFSLLMKEGLFTGVPILGTHYDLGSKLGFLTANIAFGLENAELTEWLLAFLTKIPKK